ncbi:ArsR/SmtB family transcription factor [Streptomyces daliensis]
MVSYERPVHRLDARSLRAVAHPLRMRLLGSLREYGPATASQLAARLGESSGATSYHLRQLAEYGFVRDDPERGTGRERWWKSAHEGTRIDSVNEFFDHTDPEVRGALHLFLQEMAAHHALELASFLGTFQEWPTPWREVSDVSDFQLSLTPRQVRELTSRLHEVVESYRDSGVEAARNEHDEHDEHGERDGQAEHDEQAETVRIHLHAFPRPPEVTA